jgi:chemotaxis protein MotA
MKAITGIGIVVGIVGILASAIMEGTSPAAFINIPALLLISAGTCGAVSASTNFKSFMLMPKLAILAAKGQELDPRAAIKQMVALAEKARRNGLLALEEDVAKIDDAYTRKGLQLVVDGTDSDLVAAILEAEVDGLAARHQLVAGLFATAGGFAPTVGIIGTVMGLIHVLENLAAPSTLGPAISGAFIATLMGVGSANVVYYPVANKLKEISGEEAELRTLTVEGILAIQAGDNPRVVEDKLMAFVPPNERNEDDAAAGSGGSKPKLAEAA